MKQWICISSALLFLLAQGAFAQEETCYALSLSEHTYPAAVVLPSFQSCLSYEDRYGMKDHLTITFTNAYGRKVGQYELPKTFGHNQQALDFASVGISQTEERYTLSFTDDIGQKHRIPFLVKISESDPPTVDIESEAVSLDCEASTGNVVQYFGNIQGGKAPYQIAWKVLDESGKELYQPRQDHIAKKGYTPTITVESTPTYYVSLEIQDACGETAQQVINLQCDGDVKKSNTLFVKSIRPKQETTP